MRSAGRDRREAGTELLDLLASGDPPAFATDSNDRIIFWNRGAEQVLGRGAAQALGRRCHEILRGRDVFGNLFCHEECSVTTMTRLGEPVHGFEMLMCPTPGQEQRLNVTIFQIPGTRPDLFTVVHVLQQVDASSRLARALETLGATQPSSEAIRLPKKAPPPGETPPLTEREKEILRWVAAGLQNKEVAQKLGISLATVRNHIHNILEKMGVHSKLEAVSVAFRQGWVVPPPELPAES